MARAKAKYRWVGTKDVRNVEAFSAISVSDVGKMLPPLADIQVEQDVTIERCLVHILTSRLLTSDLSEYGYIIAMQKTDGIGVLTEVLDPSTTDPFDLANRDILAIGQIPVPPIIHNGVTNATHIDRSNLLHTIDVKVRRKIHRANNVLTLTLASNVGNVLSVSVLTRVLVRTQ